MSTERKCVYENSWILLKGWNGEIDLKWLQNKYERDKYDKGDAADHKNLGFHN